MSENIYNLIRKEYDQKQKQIHDKLKDRKEEVFSKVPELDEIESKIQSCGLKYSKLILSGKNFNDTETSALFLDMEKLRNRKKGC